MSPRSPASAISLSLPRRVVLEQVADHQHAVGRARPPRPRARRRRRRLRQRLLDEAVLAGLAARARRGPRGSAPASRARPRRARVLEQLVERRRRAHAGKRAATRARACRVGVAQPGELAPGQRGEVAREVRAPVAEAGDADASSPPSSAAPRRRARRRARRRTAAAARRDAARSSAASAASRVEVDEHVPAGVDGLRPLRRVAQRHARHAGQVGLLLHAAGVGQHRARVLSSSAVKSR